ncbi:hypothetical protein [Yoonia sp.]|uniref:hypothetical protein n=1 Tax=Yoonia sp. TaxID=2212373 RepID=UPI0025CCBF95|nr:hypothetical protein [Yoonia sp.]
MFRLLRLMILTMLAFVAGMMFERSNARENCETGTGLWISNICVGLDITND